MYVEEKGATKDEGAKMGGGEGDREKKGNKYAARRGESSRGPRKKGRNSPYMGVRGFGGRPVGPTGGIGRGPRVVVTRRSSRVTHTVAEKHGETSHERGQASDGEKRKRQRG